mgnify:CR=1 FL=1
MMVELFVPLGLFMAIAVAIACAAATAINAWM